MSTIADVKWGAYRNLEGPIYKGPPDGLYVLPANPTESDRIVYVTTVIESGNYGAINMYDRGIVSCGLIQFIEGLGQFSVSSMLGAVAEVDRGFIKSVDDRCKEIGVAFVASGPLGKAQWRFMYTDGRGTVDTTPEQQKLFYLNSTGEKGTWDPVSITHAKKWALAIGSVWDNPLTQKIQRNFTAKRMMGFASQYAKTIIDNAPPSPLGGAFTASYLSFAVNNPKWASEALKVAIADQGRLSPWSPDWLVHVLKYLTFNAKISIYPHRYQMMRPALEKLYGVDLPDFAPELEKWKAETGHHRFFEPWEIQQALIDLGFDLGPSKADGKWGPKSSEALLLFEQQNGIPDADGKPDPVTLGKLEAALEQRKQPIA